MSVLCCALNLDVINLLIQPKSLTVPWALPGAPLPARGPPTGTLSTAQGTSQRQREVAPVPQACPLICNSHLGPAFELVPHGRLGKAGGARPITTGRLSLVVTPVCNSRAQDISEIIDPLNILDPLLPAGPILPQRHGAPWGHPLPPVTPVGTGCQRGGMARGHGGDRVLRGGGCHRGVMGTSCVDGGSFGADCPSGEPCWDPPRCPPMGRVRGGQAAGGLQTHA